MNEFGCPMRISGWEFWWPMRFDEPNHMVWFAKFPRPTEPGSVKRINRPLPVNHHGTGMALRSALRLASTLTANSNALNYACRKNSAKILAAADRKRQRTEKWKQVSQNIWNKSYYYREKSLEIFTCFLNRVSTSRCRGPWVKRLLKNLDGHEIGWTHWP